MFDTSNRKVWVVLASVALFAACGKVPQVQVDAAASTLAEAETVGASGYAAAELADARLANEALTAEIAAQAEKFALFRSYDRTSELAEAAAQAALAARTAAEAARVQAQEDATVAIQGLTDSEQVASSLLAELGSCKRKPKGFAADLEALSGTMAGFAQERAAVEGAMASEDFLGAAQLAASIQAQVDSLILEMDEAKTKIGC